MRLAALFRSALGAAGLAALLGLAAWGQDGSSIPDLDPDGCSNGTYVSGPDSGPGLVSDCKALVAVRNHWTRLLGGVYPPPGFPLLAWGVGPASEIADWEGVTVESGRVTRLDLADSGLAGAAPAELGLLTGLVYLNLGFNDLTSAIPPELGRLTRLEELYLNANRLTGRVPAELTGLSRLRSFLATGNDIEGPLPAELRKLPPFDDELGLILYGGAIRRFVQRASRWDVWFCDIGGPLDLDENMIMDDLLNSHMRGYFRWISGGGYDPVFSFQGEVRSRDEYGCFTAFLDAEKQHPVLSINNGGRESGWGGPLAYPGEPGGMIVSPSVVAVGGGNIIPPEGILQARLSTIAHEMGHVLTFPHSYGGLTRNEDGSTNEYDNPMDVMSIFPNPLSLGTIAVNRYAAGWIDPDDVAVYEGGSETHSLGSPGAGGRQMIVVHDEDDPYAYYTLGARVISGYDRNLPKEGVEVYRIEQRLTGEPCPEGCWRIDRRTQPFPAGAARFSVKHVFGAGESFVIEDTQVEVLAREGGRFTVRLGPAPENPPPPQETCAVFEGRFCDDDGSVHEANIEDIAYRGITLGCGEIRFCPDRPIDRSQMAAFLFRAAVLRTGTPPAPAEAKLTDVPEDAWYRSFAQWAVASAAMRAPGGVFDPHGAVTRADMAVMLTAAFDNLPPAPEPEGVFTDMAGRPPETVRAAEGLRTAGVTLGCTSSPLRYCPDQAVSRAQMASFFIRALTPR